MQRAACRRTTWSNRGLSAYTWLRTNRGPQAQWLHHIGKATSPTCTRCDTLAEESGDHITFQCQGRASERRKWLAGAKSWEELDNPIWSTKEEGGGEEVDKVETFFEIMYIDLAGRG